MEFGPENIVASKDIRDKELIKKEVAMAQDLGKELVDGEREKTPEEIKFIDFSNFLLMKEFEILGIEKDSPVSADQIHIMPEKYFNNTGQIDGRLGSMRPLNQSIFVNETMRTEKIREFKVILHEMTHLYSCTKYKAERSLAGKEKIYPSVYRLGYYIHEGDKEHLRGFNEWVTEFTIINMLARNEKEFRNRLGMELGIKEDEELKMPFSLQIVDFLKKIISGIAEKKGEDGYGVWLRFEKGMFTGEMMHLRDIEDVYGKGALRILACIDSFSGLTITKERMEKFIAYFETTDELEREEIAKYLLDKKERKAYKKEGKV